MPKSPRVRLYSPLTDDLEVVLDALVVDVLALLEVAHGNLGVADGRLDRRHGADTTEERRGCNTGGDHVVPERELIEWESSSAGVLSLLDNDHSVPEARRVVIDEKEMMMER